MRLVITLLLICLFWNGVFSQKSIDSTLEKFNQNTVSYVYPNELKSSKNLILLDTRKKEEYEVSKIEDAIWVGYKKFKIDALIEKFPNKNTPIVVYCSIGVRSEDIGEKLLKAGYSNVRNLYGGIFQWKNNGNPVFDNQNNKTEKVHAFSKHWGKLLTNAEKIYTTKSKPVEENIK
ncbi:rhodanese-like domain-containing protein [uncultured Croceitalea sp.]|uniref:rhodanese-like domain-containing protein n=1 Tax=uncultured Croceitalea sp. TaxID=1798908 RepID=UPI003305ACE6